MHQTVLTTQTFMDRLHAKRYDFVVHDGGDFVVPTCLMLGSAEGYPEYSVEITEVIDGVTITHYLPLFDKYVPFQRYAITGPREITFFSRSESKEVTLDEGSIRLFATNSLQEWEEAFERGFRQVLRAMMDGKKETVFSRDVFGTLSASNSVFDANMAYGVTRLLYERAGEDVVIYLCPQDSSERSLGSWRRVTIEPLAAVGEW